MGGEAEEGKENYIVRGRLVDGRSTCRLHSGRERERGETEREAG